MKKTKPFNSMWSLLLLLMLTLVPQRTWAWWQDSAGAKHIVNADDFAEFSSFVNGGILTSVTGNFKLDNDITLPSDWVAIGTDNSGKRFAGTFDGQGHTITFSGSSQGLFGCTDGATIQNVKLAGSISSGQDNTGSVVSTARGATKIYNVYSSVGITMTAAKSHIGGIAGQILQADGKTGEIKGCTYSGTMNLGSSTDSNGGIVGYCGLNANIEIENCFFSGSISSTGSNPRIGGILGYADDDGNTQNFKYIRNCFCDGTLSPSTGQYIGIFAGYPRGKVKDVITNNTYVSTASTNMAGNSTQTTAANNGCKKITISVTAGANGTVSHSYVNPTSTTATQLQVVATPNAHYHFGSWSDSGAQTHNVGLTADVNLSASFAIDQHTITLGPVTNGTIAQSGNGTYNYGSTVTLTATPASHYHFVQWNDGVKTASRQISVTGNATYTATFAIDQHTISVATNNANYGTVSGGGTFDYGTTNVSITATPKAHYHFVQWNDGITDASRQITVNGNATYTATFAIDQHTITVQTNNGNYGTVTGGGTYNYGTQQTITATPEEHYHFVQWNDGNTNASRQITVNGNATYTATFAIDQHTITVQVNNNNYGTVTGSGTYNYGTQQTITATPKTGYKFVQWSDGNTNASRQITVEDDATYTATFAPKAKAVLNNGTLTFYYDAINHDGETYPLNTGDYIPGWYNNRNSITSVVFDPNFAAARPTSCCSWFSYCINLTSIIGLEHLNTKEVENMSYMFHFCRRLTSLDLKNFNTFNVIDMSYMFYGCDALSSLDISSFNTENVRKMENMFYGCDALESLTIGNFDMQKVTDAGNMFYACALLNTLTMKSLPFLKQGTFNTQFSGDGKTVNVILDDNSEIYIILYDNSEIYTDGTNYLPAATSATFNREIVADGGMYSFIVPFDIPAGQAAELGKFYQYTSHDPEERKVYFDDIAEVSDGVVKANTAYFFKPARDITSFTVNNPSIPRTLTIPDPENPSVPGLYGTYSPIEVPIGAYGYVVQDGQSTFVRAGYSNLLWPFRAYLWLGSGAYMAKAHAIRGQQKGDVNGDGKISLADLTLLIEILNGRATDTTGNADVDGKNGVTIDDLEILRNCILGLLNIEDLYPEYDGQTPTGFCINYDDEEQVPTISESIWDR